MYTSQSQINAIAFLNEVLVVATMDGKITIHHTNTNVAVYTHTTPLLGLAVLNQRNILVAARADGNVSVWNTDARHEFSHEVDTILADPDWDPRGNEEYSEDPDRHHTGIVTAQQIILVIMHVDENQGVSFV
jgi:WD40 repeat protein